MVRHFHPRIGWGIFPFEHILPDITAISVGPIRYLPDCESALLSHCMGGGRGKYLRVGQWAA